MKVEQLKVNSKLVLDDLILTVGDIVDGIRVTSKTYKVFVRNGWWAVPAEYFI